MSTSPGVIYVIENRVNHKVYVGQTTMSFKRRLWIHAHSSKGIFGNAIRKHGIENFSIKVMACSECHMDWMEREWIREMNCLAPLGYNLEEGGHKHKHHHPDTRKKLSLSHMGKYPTAETRKKMSESHSGKHHTPESREKMSSSLKGREITQEHRKKLSDVRRRVLGEGRGRRGKNV